MQTIGEVFRTEREQRLLSYKDVEAATGIRAAYIAAIEDGEYARTPGEVFLKGFIRSYAVFLQLDPDSMLELYRQQRPQTKAEPEQQQTQVASERAVKLPDTITGSRWMVLAALIVAVTAVVGYGGYRVLSAPAGIVSKNEQQVPAKQAVQPANPAGAAPAAVQQGIRVTAAFSETCWLQVQVDGKEVFEGLMERGQKATWEGRSTVEVHMGNAGAAELQVNQQAIGKLGDPGDVVHKVFTAGGKS